MKSICTLFPSIGMKNIGSIPQYHWDEKYFLHSIPQLWDEKYWQSSPVLGCKILALFPFIIGMKNIGSVPQHHWDEMYLQSIAQHWDKY